MERNGWKDFRAFRDTMQRRAEERARWHRRQRIKRLKGRIVALGALEVVLNAAINQAVTLYSRAA